MAIGRMLFNFLNAALLTIGLIITFLGFFTNMQGDVPLAGIADERLRQSSLIIGVLAIFLVGTAIFGFIGVNRGIKFFTGVYIILLSLASLAFVALGVYVVVNAVKMRRIVKENTRSKMEAYYYKKEAKEEMDIIQRQYECCGILNKARNSTIEVFGLHPIPKSCCEEGTEHCMLADIFKVGCDEKVEKRLQQLSYPLAGVSFFCVIYCCIVMFLAATVKKE